MQKHHFHFTPYDTIAVAQKAYFKAGGKYCSAPPKQLNHHPLRLQQEESHCYKERNTHTRTHILMATRNKVKGLAFP